MDRNKYTIKRAVRVPQLRLIPGEDFAVQFTEEMHEEPARGKNSTGNVTVCKVIDLETGELATILIASVLKQLLTEEKDYVDKCYLIGVGEISAENTWRDYTLFEIDNPLDNI
tara:strand:+ start:528 stop:866 length:339 start_codon:yes stop_codon:yes gene_type:complete